MTTTTQQRQYRVWFWNSIAYPQLQAGPIFSTAADAEAHAREELPRLREFVTQARVLTHPTNALVMVIKRE